jgi:hypothetical protein
LSELAFIYNSMDRSKQQRVLKRLAFSGALPLSRDTASYTAVMSVVDGGLAGQFDYAQSEAASSTAAFSSTMGAAEEATEFRNSRAEAKRLHLERMSHLRQNDSNNAPLMAAAAASAEPKISAFHIAVSVANASDAKVHHIFLSFSATDSLDFLVQDAKPLPEVKPVSESNKTAQKFRLLGDLPALGAGNGAGPGGRQQSGDQSVADRTLDVQLHQPQKFMMKPSNIAESKGGNGECGWSA